MLRSEPRGDGGDHRRAGDDPRVAAISGWEPRLNSVCVFGKLLYNSSPVFHQYHWHSDLDVQELQRNRFKMQKRLPKEALPDQDTEELFRRNLRAQG